jgi:hypothetical protein
VPFDGKEGERDRINKAHLVGPTCGGHTSSVDKILQLHAQSGPLHKKLADAGGNLGTVV